MGGKKNTRIRTGARRGRGGGRGRLGTKDRREELAGTGGDDSGGREDELGDPIRFFGRRIGVRRAVVGGGDSRDAPWTENLAARSSA